jgi:hypothetical protein
VQVACGVCACARARAHVCVCGGGASGGCAGVRKLARGAARQQPTNTAGTTCPRRQGMQGHTPPHTTPHHGDGLATHTHTRTHGAPVAASSLGCAVKGVAHSPTRSRPTVSTTPSHSTLSCGVMGCACAMTPHECLCVCVCVCVCVS